MGWRSSAPPRRADVDGCPPARRTGADRRCRELDGGRRRLPPRSLRPARSHRQGARRASPRARAGDRADHSRPVMLDAQAHQVAVHATRVYLTPSEFRLLAFLMLRAGRCCPKEAILDHLLRRAGPAGSEDRRRLPLQAAQEAARRRRSARLSPDRLGARLHDRQAGRHAGTGARGMTASRTVSAPARARPLAPPAAIEASGRRCAVCGGDRASFGAEIFADRPGRWLCHAHSAYSGRRAS